MDNDRLEAGKSMEAYSREWYGMMTKIWNDRIALMGVIRTGTLRSSVTGGGLRVGDFDLTATFRFVQYGLYVDAGTGNGYKRGNGGELRFLEKDYRTARKLGKPRQKKPWFSKSWYVSRQVLKDKMAEIIGEAFVGVFDEIAG